MATVMDTLFPAELTTPRRAPLIDSATELFAEHWTGAAGEEISVPAHDSLELVTRVCQEWQANVRRADASATHAAELQAHVAALEERLANPTEEQPSGGPSTQSGPTPGPVAGPTPDPTAQCFTTEPNAGVKLWQWPEARRVVRAFGGISAE